MSGDITGDEAAWRDLIARFDLVANFDQAAAPWPEAENLGSTAVTSAQPGSAAGTDSATGNNGATGTDGATGPGIDQREASGPAAGTGERETGERGTGGGAPERGAAGPAAAADVGERAERAAAPDAAEDPAGTKTDVGGAETAAGTGGADTAAGPADPADPIGPAGAIPAEPAGGRRQPPGSHRARIVRPAFAPKTPADRDFDDAENDRYIPPPPPPLPTLDPVTKGAWVALCGGPAYLLLTTILGWQLSGLGALLAVMAFVGGFAVIVLRMGDGPSRGDDPDNGAVL